MRTGRRFRPHVLLGALALVGSGFVTWWRTGGEAIGEVVVPDHAGIGLQGAGLVSFAVAVVTLMLLNVGYMRGRWGFALDGPATYLALGMAAGVATIIRGWELWSVGYVPIPQASPGFALAVLGSGLVLYGAGVGLAEGDAPAR